MGEEGGKEGGKEGGRGWKERHVPGEKPSRLGDCPAESCDPKWPPRPDPSPAESRACSSCGEPKPPDPKPKAERRAERGACEREACEGTVGDGR